MSFVRTALIHFANIGYFMNGTVASEGEHDIQLCVRRFERCAKRLLCSGIKPRDHLHHTGLAKPQFPFETSGHNRPRLAKLELARIWPDCGGVGPDGGSGWRHEKVGSHFGWTLRRPHQQEGTNGPGEEQSAKFWAVRERGRVWGGVRWRAQNVEHTQKVLTRSKFVETKKC